jgi:aspartyl-tRNA(Asn)/glutamyl-tRNA(Gln) amidotransferase subunit B
MKTYTPVIGLEIHVELKTKTKMFCQCSADYFGAKPNTHTCPVCLGLPGALPVPNRIAIEWMQKIGKALNCELAKHSKFDRKHYFYPDLPKGYQISQYDKPFAIKGKLTIASPYLKEGEKSFRIHRVHMEEDTAKLIHAGNDTLVDFNRSSVPLVEIVTEPDFSNADEVKVFLEELHTIIRYLDVSDADLEKGSMRMEPNISVKIAGTEGLPPYKVEVKNINSFNFVKRAIEFEVKRHIELLEEGKTPIQETRGWNSEKGITYSQRTKEDAQDYRYFPEPDIPPFDFSEEYEKNVVNSMPELPNQRVERYEKMGVKKLDAFIITRDRNLSDYFDTVLVAYKKENKEVGIEQKIASAIINKRISVSLSPSEFIKKVLELTKPIETDSSALDESVKTVLASNEKAVTEYKSGKQSVIMFLVGQVMKQMKGKADASVVRKALEENLKG